MLYLIGLGLNIDGISKYGAEILGRCKKVYLENYTVDFPYSSGELAHLLDKKVEEADRDFIEGLSFVDEAAKKDVALLIYGSPLSATTHITIIDECAKSGVKCKVIYAGSVFDAVGETGLQQYKFGKTASMPAWKKSFEPTSFMEIVKENQSIDAHSLILIDIGLEFPDMLAQLEKAAAEHDIKLKDLVVCQQLGTRRQKILYRNLKDLQAFTGVKAPYCIIIPGKLHHIEEEVLEGFR